MPLPAEPGLDFLSLLPVLCPATRSLVHHDPPGTMRIVHAKGFSAGPMAGAPCPLAFFPCEIFRVSPLLVLLSRRSNSERAFFFVPRYSRGISHAERDRWPIYPGSRTDTFHFGIFPPSWLRPAFFFVWFFQTNAFFYEEVHPSTCPKCRLP